MGHIKHIMISLWGQVVKIRILISGPESAIEIRKRFHCDQNLSDLPTFKKSTVWRNSREVFHVLVPGVTTLKLNLLNWKKFSFVLYRLYITQTKENPQGNTIRSQRLHRMKIKWTISEYVRMHVTKLYGLERAKTSIFSIQNRDQRAEYPIYMLEHQLPGFKKLTSGVKILFHVELMQIQFFFHSRTLANKLERTVFVRLN